MLIWCINTLTLDFLLYSVIQQGLEAPFRSKSVKETEYDVKKKDLLKHLKSVEKES